MDPNMNPQECPPVESHDSYPSFDSNPPVGQDSASRPRGHNSHQGPYPTSSPRMRPQGNFQSRGRYSYNKRGGGGYRQQNRGGGNFNQQQEQSSDTNAYQATASSYTNRNYKGFFRATMLEDPWAHLSPLKVPANGTTLVFDSTHQ